jgi:hypothetical protein
MSFPATLVCFYVTFFMILALYFIFTNLDEINAFLLRAIA